MWERRTKPHFDYRFYDSLSRLIGADYNNGETVYNYGYDVAGNLVDYDGVTRTYNAANQMTNDDTNSLTYDNNGNLRTVGSDTYVWDRANRLLSVGNHSYVYDGLGARVQQTVSSIVTDYLNDVQPALTKLLKQTTGANVERFVHAPRGIHAVDDGTDWSFYAQDGLGSVRAMVDDAATVVSSHSYSPIGVPDSDYGSGFWFTGEQTDENYNIYLRARYMKPNLGIFLSRDPFEGFQSRPMSLNGYMYVEGNVPNAVDPSGNCPDNPASWDLTGRHCREIARNLAENYNIPFEELVQLPYGQLLQIQALGSLTNTSNFLRDQASNIPIIPTLFYQNPQAAWQATMQVLSGCGSGAKVPALGAVITGGSASSKTPYGLIIAGLSFATLVVIAGTATIAGQIDRTFSQDRDDSNVTAVPLPLDRDIPDYPTQTPAPEPCDFNLDSSTLTAMSGTSATALGIQAEIRQHVGRGNMCVTDTAFVEWQLGMISQAGPLEQTNGVALLLMFDTIPDKPSRRFLALDSGGSLEPNDITIFGTGDRLGIQTLTADGRAIRGIAGRGILDFNYWQHGSVRLQGV